MAALLVFLLTYLIIAGQKVPGLSLDRPAGALVGAVLMVWTGTLTRAEAVGAIHFDTILLLLGMMILSAYLAEAAFFRWCAYWAVRLARTPRGLLLAVVAVSGGLSALLVNDTVCVMVTPLVLQVCRDTELDPLPYLLALAAAANVGSVVTLTGNPQNMIVGTLSGWSYNGFFLRMLPVGLGGLAVTWGLLRWMFRRRLPPGRFRFDPEPPPVRRGLLILGTAVLALAVAAFVAGYSLAGTAMVAASAMLALARVPPARILPRVDWSLLLFFCGLFVVVEGVNRAGWGEVFFRAFAPILTGGRLQEILGLSALTAALSNVVSNVPMVLVAAPWMERLSDPPRLWLVLAMASTFAGNLTLVGSVANLIVAELARAEGVEVGFGAHLRAGVPVTLLTLAWGAAVLAFIP